MFYAKMLFKFPKFQDPILCVFACFGDDFSFRRALQIRKCILELCCGYLKHPPESAEYVSEKIMVIRCVEPNIKRENDVLLQSVA